MSFGGLSTIVIMLPLQLFLLSKANIKHGEFLPGELNVNPQRLRGFPEERKIRSHKDFTLAEALKDIKFYIILLASCLPPMVVTGLFFHQETLFHSNGWAISLAASGIVVYAVCKAISSIWVGVVVDRFGPLLPFVILIVLLGAGTSLAGFGGSSLIVYVYYCLIGAALGFSSPVSNVVWPYFYGTKHIGSIKGIVATFRNGLTAFGTLPIALALDAGISINTLLQWLGYTVILMSCLPMIVWYLEKKES